MTNKKTAFGNMLNAYMTARDLALRTAKRDILKRNKAYSATNPDYKLVQDKIMRHDGTESIAVTLWKKVDEVVISIASDIKVETETRTAITPQEAPHGKDTSRSDS